MNQIEYTLDSESYYTTIEQDINHYNTHILQNISILWNDVGEPEKARILICNNRVSFDRTGGMGKIEDWIEDEEDWEGICPKCRKEYEERLKNANQQ